MDLDRGHYSTEWMSWDHTKDTNLRHSELITTDYWYVGLSLGQPIPCLCVEMFYYRKVQELDPDILTRFKQNYIHCFHFELEEDTFNIKLQIIINTTFPLHTRVHFTIATCPTSLVPNHQSLMWSQIALAADIALESLRALITAAPLVWMVYEIKFIHIKYLLSCLSILANLNEVSLDPCVVVDGLLHRLLLAIDCHHGVCHIRELGGWVVAPDDDVLHSTARYTQSSCYLNTWING